MEKAVLVLTTFIQSTLGPGGVEAGQLRTVRAGRRRQAGMLAMIMCMEMQMSMWQQREARMVSADWRGGGGGAGWMAHVGARGPTMCWY